MPRDLSDSLKDLVEKGYNWTQYRSKSGGGRNRAQAQGAHLEDIVKDILCGIEADDANGREALLDKYLSFQGAANNPPDAMYRGGNDGDAFEVKKSENKSSGSLDLNSSHPYSHLTSDLSRIAREARECEEWDKRDIFYVVGNVLTSQQKNNWIWFVQGNIFAAELQSYRDFESDIKSHIEQAITDNGLTPGVTNELGRINGVDLRENTDLRIRPMWGISSPMKLFRDLKGIEESDAHGLVIHCLVRKSKWEKFLKDKPESSKQFWSKSKSPKMTISDVAVPDPNNLNGNLEVKLIRIVLDLP
jgi:NgoPII restriction endonuclease